MIPKQLEGIEPEFADSIPYSKPGESYLVGPGSQHLNSTAYKDEPTRPLDVGKNATWAREIRSSQRVSSVTAHS